MITGATLLDFVLAVVICPASGASSVPTKALADVLVIASPVNPNAFRAAPLPVPA
jgi:hypothetical protein